MNVCKLDMLWSGLDVQDNQVLSGGYRPSVVERSICVSKLVHGMRCHRTQGDCRLCGVAVQYSVHSHKILFSDVYTVRSYLIEPNRRPNPRALMRPCFATCKP
jgi:hypothetical protein